MNVRQFIGKHVIVTDPERFDCGHTKAGESKEHQDWHRSTPHGDEPECHPSDVFRTDGKVQAVDHYRDVFWLIMEDGRRIDILESTTVEEAL